MKNAETLSFLKMPPGCAKGGTRTPTSELTTTSR